MTSPAPPPMRKSGDHVVKTSVLVCFLRQSAITFRVGLRVSWEGRTSLLGFQGEYSVGNLSPQSGMAKFMFSTVIFV